MYAFVWIDVQTQCTGPISAYNRYDLVPMQKMLEWQAPRTTEILRISHSHTDHHPADLRQISAIGFRQESACLRHNHPVAFVLSYYSTLHRVHEIVPF